MTGRQEFDDGRLYGLSAAGERTAESQTRLNEVVGLLEKVRGVLPPGDTGVGFFDGSKGAASIIGPYVELTHEAPGSGSTDRIRKGLRVESFDGQTVYTVGTWTANFVNGGIRSGEGLGTQPGVPQLELPRAISEGIDRLFPGDEGLRERVAQVLFPQPQTS